MARKISERERLITFVLNASVEQLTEAKELIDTALRNRQPKRPAKKANKKPHFVTGMSVGGNPPPEN